MVARWSWHPDGWSKKLGSMDFAGGTAVHITSGTTVAAISAFYAFETRGFLSCMQHFKHIVSGLVNSALCCCKSSRKEHNTRAQGAAYEMRNGEEGTNGNADTAAGQDHETEAPAESLEVEDDAPHNINNVVLGTALLWIGWFGFNGGSALGGNLRAVLAITSTHIAACSGGSANILLFWLFNNLAQKYPRGPVSRKLSIMWFCDGAIIALVAITPAAGYVRLRRSLATKKLLTDPGPRLERPNLWLGFLHLC